MLEDSLDELHLRVRSRDPQDRGAAERFARRVLERSAELLAQRQPERLVLVRQLALRWRLGRSDLDDHGEIESRAVELCEGFEDAAPHGVASRPAEDLDTVVFENETAWRAAHLLARARGGADAWFFHDLEAEGDPLIVLARAEHRRLAWEVLTGLAAADGLIEVLRAAAPRMLQLASALGVAAAPHRGSPLGASDVSPSLVRQLLEWAHTLPTDLPPEVLRLALEVHAHAQNGIGNDPDNGHGTAQRAAHAAAAALAAQRAVPSAAVNPRAPALRKPRGEPKEKAQTTDGRAPLKETPELSGSPSADIAVLYGGLFYLLNPALELGLGEVLWKACLSENQVLLQALNALLGEDQPSDLAVSLVAGAALDAEVPDVKELAVESAQQEEVSRALLSALARSLPRRGLAELPEVVLALTGDPHRLLVAVARGSSFPLFAWPAATPAAARRGVDAFLQAWTESAPPVKALPPLAELDPDGRIHPVENAEVSPRLLLPAAGSPASGALLAQVVGSLGHLFEARVTGRTSPHPSAFVERFLRLPGRVHLAHEEMIIVLPAEQVDLGVRRAGLDRNPGWVPWLERTVRLEFEGEEEAADTGPEAPL